MERALLRVRTPADAWRGGFTHAFTKFERGSQACALHKIMALGEAVKGLLRSYKIGSSLLWRF